jgi:hypothetical protein
MSTRLLRCGLGERSGMFPEDPTLRPSLDGAGFGLS